MTHKSGRQNRRDEQFYGKHIVNSVHLQLHDLHTRSVGQWETHCEEERGAEHYVKRGTGSLPPSAFSFSLLLLAPKWHIHTPRLPMNITIDPFSISDCSPDAIFARGRRFQVQGARHDYQCIEFPQFIAGLTSAVKCYFISARSIFINHCRH